MVPIAPRRLPLLGHLPALIRDPLGLLQGARHRGDIARLHLGRQPCYLINSPEFVRQALVSEASSFERGRIFEKARAFVGQGLATSDGALHLRQRRIMQPAFHLDRMADYFRIIRAETEATASRWQAGQNLAFRKEMATLTITIVTKSIFRSHISERTVAEIQHSLPFVAQGLIIRTLLPDFCDRVFTRNNRRFDNARTCLRSVVRETAARYRADGVDHRDLLSALVNARHEDSGAPMSEEQVCDEIITVLIGGSEATATALSWLFYELGRNQDIEANCTLSWTRCSPADL